MGIPIIGDILNVVGGVLDKVVPDKNEKMKLEHELQTALMQLDFGQMEINKQEAAHKSIFVSGWRPFIGWVCGFGLAYNFVFQPLLNWAGNAFLENYVFAPALELGPLLTILMGMLGMAGYRTFEKVKGVARN